MSGVEMLLGILIIQMFFVIFGNIKRNELLAEMSIHNMTNNTAIKEELQKINKVVSDK